VNAQPSSWSAVAPHAAQATTRTVITRQTAASAARATTHRLTLLERGTHARPVDTALPTCSALGHVLEHALRDTTAHLHQHRLDLPVGCAQQDGMAAVLVQPRPAQVP